MLFNTPTLCQDKLLRINVEKLSRKFNWIGVLKATNLNYSWNHRNWVFAEMFSKKTPEISSALLNISSNCLTTVVFLTRVPSILKGSLKYWYFEGLGSTILSLMFLRFRDLLRWWKPLRQYWDFAVVAHDFTKFCKCQNPCLQTPAISLFNQKIYLTN